MTFHTTTPSRIREIDSTSTVEYRATLHYSDSRYFTGDATAVVVDENAKEVQKMKRNPFKPKAPHHAYIGAFLLFLAYTMWDYDYYHPLAEITATIGAYITIDDIIEHTITAKTPLR